MTASYIDAYTRGLLGKRIERARIWMRRCTLCPRLCRVNRLEDERGQCLIGRYAVVASYGPHFGEESPLVGEKGSGTIFFAGCNLGCVFCQNYEISHTAEGISVASLQLAEMMLDLQRQGCHNINVVTPSHVVPQILESLPYAIERGLKVPLVYNSSGYDRVPTLRLLRGIVDIYMPDVKCLDASLSAQWYDAGDYPERVREAVREMHRQVGDLVIEDGIAVRGLLVRHLVMPGCLDDTRRVLDYIAEEISPLTYVNIMDQYRPAGAVWDQGDPRLLRFLSKEAYLDALRYAQERGLTRVDDRRSFFRWLFRKP